VELSKNVSIDDTEFLLELGDLVAFHPFTTIHYTVYGFNKFSNTNIICVIEDSNIISRDVTELASIIKLADVQTPTKKPKKQRRRVSKIEQALKEVQNNV
jgi:hypothetical protein